jgi:hypothetical protein
MAQNQNDPFGSQRNSANDPFAAGRSSSDNAIDDSPAAAGEGQPRNPKHGDRRESNEWGMPSSHHSCVVVNAVPKLTPCSTIDASKVPPSQFQKRKGSIYAVPGSRDSHTDSAHTRDKSFHEKLKEKGWLQKSK